MPTPADNISASPAAGRWMGLWRRRWPTPIGIVLGLIVLGPGLGAGSLLSLDLLVTPHIPVPDGLYGLGPALSQRVPSFTVLALASELVGGPVAVKVAIVAMVAVAFVGAVRLVGPDASALTAAGAGVLWAAGPYALTRIGVGHLNVTWAVAVLPWVLPRLCRPSDRPSSTFLAAGLLAFGGPASGTLGLVLVAVALVVERRRRPVAVVAVSVAANLVWALPTAVLLWAGARVTGSGGFATRPRAAVGWAAILSGGGFWRPDLQVGAVGVVGAVAGLVLLGLAWIGRSHLDPRWGRPATAAGLVGLAIALASAVPGVRVPYGWLTDLPVGAPLRESQRFLALWLVVAAPAAALGAAELARRVQRSWVVVLALPLAIGVAVGSPGWLGVDGRLRPVEFPAGWAVARSRIQRDPGPVVAFPWNEYPRLSFAGDRQAFNPMPDYLGGDVISSFDPGFHPGELNQEQVDHRAVEIDGLVRRLRAGERVGAGLRRAGVRWVVLAHESSWTAYSALQGDPDLRRVVQRGDIDVWAVVGWRGPALAPDGRPHRLDRPMPPLLRTDAPVGSVLDVAGAPGWVQGWKTPVAVTADGRLRTTARSGVIWFWPAPVLLLVDLALAGGAAWAWHRRGRSPTVVVRSAAVD